MGKLEWCWLDSDAPTVLDPAGYSEWPGWVVCGAESPQYRRNSYSTHVVCTRMAGHSGRHAASTGAEIIAVWL